MCNSSVKVAWERKHKLGKRLQKRAQTGASGANRAFGFPFAPINLQSVERSWTQRLEGRWSMEGAWEIGAKVLVAPPSPSGPGEASTAVKLVWFSLGHENYKAALVSNCEVVIIWLPLFPHMSGSLDSGWLSFADLSFTGVPPEEFSCCVHPPGEQRAAWLQTYFCIHIYIYVYVYIYIYIYAQAPPHELPFGCCCNFSRSIILLN